MLSSLTQSNTAKLTTAVIGVGTSVALYFASKGKFLKVASIALGGWSALAAYELWQERQVVVTAPVLTTPKENGPYVATGDPIPEKFVHRPDSDGDEIAALERAIANLGSPTGLPDPDMN